LGKLSMMALGEVRLPHDCATFIFSRYSPTLVVPLVTSVAVTVLACVLFPQLLLNGERGLIGGEASAPEPTTSQSAPYLQE